MINLQTEQLLTLREAAELLPGSTAISTLHRWGKQGVRGVRLETCLIGGKRFTSEQALQRFTNALSTSQNSSSPAVVPNESHTDVSRQLDVRGL